MMHARKMVLIPAESMGRLQKNNDVELKAQDPIANTVQTPGTNLSRLDVEMSEILNSLDSDERAKWKKYQQVLQRYLFFLDSGKSKNSHTEVKNEEEENKNGVSIERIISSVPVKFKRTAELLMQFLQDSEVSSRISWDNKGTVSIDGVVLEDSNIIDLINDAMRTRKSIRAACREKFSWFLHDIGVPTEFIGNKQFYKEGKHVSMITSSPRTPTNRNSYNTFFSTPGDGSLYETLSSTHENSTVIENEESFSKDKRSRKRHKLNSSQKGGSWLTLSM